MNRSSTLSEKHRRCGNEIYEKLKGDPQAAPVIRRSRFMDALKCYNAAVSSSANDDERGSAYKNIGVLFAYEISNARIDSVGNTDYKYNLKECIASYNQAYIYGKRTKPAEWVTTLYRQIEVFAYDCCAVFLSLRSENSFTMFLDLVNCFEKTILEKLDSIATAYSTLGRLAFERAVTLFQSEPKFIYECLPYLDRAIYWAFQPDKFRSDEIEELRHSIQLHQFILESSNARRSALRMLEAHLNNDEDLNMDIIWAVIDKLREAILLAKEHDIEGEACACHHTARVYQNVLKMNEIAYKYHLRCVTLAQTLVPRNLTTFDWYMASSSIIQLYRAKKDYEEQKVTEKKNEKFRVELTTELKDLSTKASEGTHPLLDHIYKTHPPRKSNATVGSTDASELLNTFKKAITHYHPDAQIQFQDEKWTFLCGEITKLLSVKYEQLKLAS